MATSSLEPAAPRSRSRGGAAAFLWLGLGYVAYYLCRGNFAIANVPMQKAGVFDATAYGWITSAGTMCYAVGKILSGSWADRFGGKRIFVIGMIGSAAVTLPTGFAPTALLVGVLWSANRLFQSMGWCGLVNVAVGWSHQQRYGTHMGLLSVSYQVGGAIAGAFAGALLAAHLGWRMLFVIPAFALGGFAIVVQLMLREAPPEAEVAPTAPSSGDVAPRPKVSLWTLLAQPAFLVSCALSFVLTLSRECFNTWLPAYFAQLGAADDAAAFKSTVFPLLGAAGTLTLGWLSDRVPSLPRGRVMALAMAVSALALLGLAELEPIAAALSLPRAGVAVILVGVVGFFLLASYSIVAGGALALDFGGRAASARAAGALDAVGYLGGGAAGIGVASLVARTSWNVTFGFLALASAVAVGLSLWIHRLATRRP